MREKSGNGFERREVLKASALALGGALFGKESLEAYPKGVNANSSPSALRITDLRVATVVKPGPSPCPIIRIDTNQGVHGLGEVRDGASPTYALFLKSRIVGENPLQLDKIFRNVSGLFSGWAINQIYNLGWNQLKEFTPDLGSYLNRPRQKKHKQADVKDNRSPISPAN